uniref:Uncharacterized protein n=1 Tax=Arundo donax TaxID=35708 RepID=A0A0A9F9U1_ARUDO
MAGAGRGRRGRAGCGLRGRAGRSASMRGCGRAQAQGRALGLADLGERRETGRDKRGSKTTDSSELWIASRHKGKYVITHTWSVQK